MYFISSRDNVSSYCVNQKLLAHKGTIVQVIRMMSLVPSNV